MRFFITILLCSVSLLNVFGQSLRTDDGIKHLEAGLTAGLNTDGYQFDFGFAYFPLNHLGVKAQLGFAGEIESIEDWGKEEWETGHYYTTRFKFTSSLVLRTPRIISWKSQDGGFYLFAEPGIILSPGARGSQNARIMNWDLKTGINLQLDRIVLTLGYGITNFALYSGISYENYNGMSGNYRDSTGKNSYKTHSGFLGIAVKF